MKNFYYFDNDTTVSEILDQYNDLLKFEIIFDHDNKDYDDVDSYITGLFSLKSIAKKSSKEIKDFLYLNDSQENLFFELLQKIQSARNNIFVNYYNARFRFLFAIFDYISRIKLPHSLKEIENDNPHWRIFSFDGELASILDDMQNVAGLNPISFYCHCNDECPEINFQKDWKSIAKQFKKCFISDMSKKEYDDLMKSYEKYLK